MNKNLLKIEWKINELYFLETMQLFPYFTEL